MTARLCKYASPVNYNVSVLIWTRVYIYPHQAETEDSVEEGTEHQIPPQTNVAEAVPGKLSEVQKDPWETELTFLPWNTALPSDLNPEPYIPEPTAAAEVSSVLTPQASKP